MFTSNWNCYLAKRFNYSNEYRKSLGIWSKEEEQDFEKKCIETGVIRLEPAGKQIKDNDGRDNKL